MPMVSARLAARSRRNRGNSGPKDVSTRGPLCQCTLHAPCAHPAFARARTLCRGVLWYLRGGRVGALILLMINKVAASLATPPRPAASRLEREPAPSAPRRRRGRGRPKGGSAGNVRERLLAAARELFLRYGYRAVSSRQIGAAAGVNFALIRYYFGGKPGLYREILQSVLPPDVGEMLGAPQEGGREMRLPDILSHMTRVWAGNPWIAGFVLREVLTPGGPIRSDLDPRLLVLSVVSLAIFPFLAFPLTSRVFGVRNDEEFVTRFLRHTQALLSSGVAPAAAAGVARAQARQ